MIRILEFIYIAVGVIFIFTVCVHILSIAFDYVCDKIERIKHDRLEIYTIRKFHELELAFHQDKKIAFVFKKLGEAQVWGRSLDVWELRDETDKVFQTGLEI